MREIQNRPVVKVNQENEKDFNKLYLEASDDCEIL